jgi:[methyl-Co(III) methanol-specific corrinoid protein]:coenzyme M methyltransferase
MKFVTGSIAEFGSAFIEAGADLVCIAEPSGTGEILGKKLFSEFALPYLNELTGYFRQHYKIPSLVHICGKLRTLGTALSSLGADAISVDSSTSIKVLKEFAPEKLAMGNVSTYLLASGDSERVLRSGKLCLARGVDILAPACGISPLTPIRSIRALSQAVGGAA